MQSLAYKIRTDVIDSKGSRLANVVKI